MGACPEEMAKANATPINGPSPSFLKAMSSLQLSTPAPTSADESSSIFCLPQILSPPSFNFGLPLAKSDMARKRTPPHLRSKVKPSSVAHKLQMETSLADHLDLLSFETGHDEIDELETTPLFTEAVRKHALSLRSATSTKVPPFSQYGLLAGQQIGSDASGVSDPRIFYNVSAPSSVFICGSQGSGKSHTLSCLLENCLFSSQANVLPRPLTGLVFHYDTLTSDLGGQPCEAAFISSNPAVKVRVLCAPTSFSSVTRIYSDLPNVTVQRLRLSESHLNTNRMMDLMAVASGNPPLYIYVVQRILRELRLEQQESGGSFDYAKFKAALDHADLTEMQRVPLKQRLETLESFMVPQKASHVAHKKVGGLAADTRAGETSWVPSVSATTS